MNAPLMLDQLVPPPMTDTQRRVVATLPGSLPGGGTVLDTPIHAFAQTPAELVFSDPARVTVRDEVDCDGALAFLIRNVVSPEEAQELIRASELFGFRSAAPGIVTPPGMRMNTSVHWVADEQSLGPIF